MVAVIGIIISLGLLIYLAYKGWSVILVAPLLASFAVLFTALAGGESHLLATYTEVFMKSLGGYVKSYFPIFLLGALFGKIMDEVGSAKSIAAFISSKAGKGKEILAVVLACAVITYGGVSLFVAVFAIYPIGVALFRASDIPKHLLPGAIALGAFTFTMTAIPGSPQIQNAIPMKYLGTDAFAAPVLGIISAVIMFGLGMLWLESRLKKARAAGEGYGDHIDSLSSAAEGEDLPSFGISMLPIIVVIAGNYVFSKFVFSGYDGAYLEQYGTSLSSVKGSWSLILALIIGIITAIAFNYKRFKGGVLACLKEGVQGSFLAIMNTASEVGYGNVIKTLAGFAIMSNALVSVVSNPLIGGAIASSALAGITGSASGGVSIALETFGSTFLQRCVDSGISPAVLHRVVAVACGGLDSLPHNGAVITLLAVCGLSHKESYVNIGMCTVAIPSVAVVVIIILGTLGIV